MIGLGPLPAEAVWRHHTVREAVEVVHLDRTDDGWSLVGCVTGVEEQVAYALAWEVVVDPGWTTRRARVRSVLPGRGAAILLERSEAGEWTVDGSPRPDLLGAVDVDLEASAVTNTLPVHREPLDRPTRAPAAYVRLDLQVEPLDQSYGPAEVVEEGLRVPYRAPRFGADFDLLLDPSGLVREYPGLATRLR